MVGQGVFPIYRMFLTKKGFTLVEMIIVVSLIAALSGLAVSRMLSFSRAQVLEQAAADFKSRLEDARSRSLASLSAPSAPEVNVNWGVSIDSATAYSLGFVEGATPFALVRSFDFPDGVEVSPASAEIVFERLSGNITSGDGIYTVSHLGSNINIVVYLNGRIE
jgi:prepilin-type N-terminal cleavage/methylation domain-containing protein